LVVVFKYFHQVNSFHRSYIASLRASPIILDVVAFDTFHTAVRHCIVLNTVLDFGVIFKTPIGDSYAYT